MISQMHFNENELRSDLVLKEVFVKWLKNKNILRQKRKERITKAAEQRCALLILWNCHCLMFHELNWTNPSGAAQYLYSRTLTPTYQFVPFVCEKLIRESGTSICRLHCFLSAASCSFSCQLFIIGNSWIELTLSRVLTHGIRNIFYMKEWSNSNTQLVIQNIVGRRFSTQSVDRVCAMMHITDAYHLSSHVAWSLLCKIYVCFHMDLYENRLLLCRPPKQVSVMQSS